MSYKTVIRQTSSKILDKSKHREAPTREESGLFVMIINRDYAEYMAASILSISAANFFSSPMRASIVWQA